MHAHMQGANRHNSCYCSKSLVLLLVVFHVPTVPGLDYGFASLRCVIICIFCQGYDIRVLPRGVLYTYTGDSETLEVYHTTQQRLSTHLRQSHIQANNAFYVPSLIRGFLWENSDYFILITVGPVGRINGGWYWDLLRLECHRGLGSFHLTGDTHHIGFLVRPQAEFIGSAISCMLQNTSIQFNCSHPVMET